MQAVKLQTYGHMAYITVIMLVGSLHVKDGLPTNTITALYAHITCLPAGHMSQHLPVERLAQGSDLRRC